MGALSACGSDPELTAPVDTMIEFEATWQCDVTRFSFESSAEIDSKLDEVRQRFGVTAQDRKIFVDMIEDDAELRDQVADRHDELCPIVES